MGESEDRERILEAAAHRFMELGISKVTLDEIASDLRMSKKTMYKHFPSKEHLAAAAMVKVMRRAQAFIAA